MSIYPILFLLLHLILIMLNSDASTPTDSVNTPQPCLSDTSSDNATAQAYHFLEDKKQGLYQELILETLAKGGIIIQAPDHFVAGYQRAEIFHILFGCGNAKSIIAVGKFYARIMGYSRVEWSRELVHKHKNINDYDMNRF